MLYAHLTHGRSFWRDNRDYNRGFWDLVRFYRLNDEYRIKPEELPNKRWYESDNVPLAKSGNRLLERPYDDGTNLLYIGTPKSGKTQTMKCAMRQFCGSIVAIDTKGDIIDDLRNERKMLIFDPTHPDESIHFNPLKNLPIAYDERKDMIEQIVLTLVPDASKDNYFTPGAQDFLRGIIYYGLEQNPHTSLAKIIHAVLKADAAFWINKILDSKCSEAIESISSYAGTNEKNVQGCYQKLCTSIKSLSRESLDLLFENDQDKPMLSLESLENGYDIYIRIPQSRVPAYSSLITLIYSSLIHGAMERQEGAQRQILVMLDEIGQYPPIYQLSNAMATLRSKSVCFVISCQSLSQIKKIYGDNDADTIMDCISYTVIFNLSDVDTQEYYSKALGTHLVLCKSNGYNNTSLNGNTTEIREPIMQPEEFGRLAYNNKVVVLANGRYFYGDKVQYYELPDKK